jgi:ribosomal protein S16
VPKRAQKMKKKSGAQEIRFLEKIGFFKPCAQTCPKNEKEILPKKSLFFWKNRISFEKTEFINGLDIGAILH